MNSTHDTVRHTCYHCQSEILPGKGCVPLDEATKRLLPSWKDYESGTQWISPLKHSTDAVREAALSGCPFFVMLWGKLNRHFTSPDALKETRLFFELEGVKREQTPVAGSKAADDLLRPTFDSPGQELCDIIQCKIMAMTQGRGNYLVHFTTVSDWESLSSVLPHLILAYFQRPDDPSAEHALARLVDGHTSSGQAIRQIQRRLQHCVARHDKCKAVPSGIRPRRFLSVGESMDTTVKVIQAQNPDNGIAEPYAALSYCWGHDQVLKTTSANKADVEDAVPLNSLPKTITDAIRITRELGIELLWVDSLCLVQDDEDELAREIAKMHHYFGNAYITISAAVPASCSDGFLQDYPIPSHDETFPFGPFYFPVDLGVPERPSTLKLVHLRLEHQAIDSRAWTLQEGLLSHRLASFGSRVVRWSCRTESYGKPVQEDLRELRHTLSVVRRGIVLLSEQQRIRMKLRLWGRIVENYTRRDLSKRSDRLRAISGISSVLSAPSNDSPERQYQVDFAAGFLMANSLTHPLTMVDSSRLEIRYQPRDHFESGLLALQLLWHAPLTRRGTLSTGLENQKQDSQASSYVAPSWSWACHVGAVGTAISTMDDDWCELFTLTAWEQGWRVREIITIPSKSEAPYGALSWGSITIDGYIFRPDEEPDRIASIAFDDGRRDIAPGDCSGLFCLQIIANVDQHSQNPRVSQLCESLWGKYPPSSLCWRLQGIVLEAVELDGNFSSGEKVYRRVGIYYVPRRLFLPSDNDPSSGEELRGRFETITII